MMKRLKYGVFGLIALFLSVSFGYCDTINNTALSISSAQTKSASCNGFCCFSSDSSHPRLPYTKISYGNVTNFGLFSGVNNSYPLTCLEIDGTFSIYNGAGSLINVYYWDITDLVPSSCPSCPSCPDCPVCEENICNLYVSQDGINTHFQYSGNIDRFTLNLDENITWFNSINGNSSYFNFQSSCLTGIVCTGSVESGNWSALFINDIQHVSAPLINITIPEEFDWDYTGTDEEFDLDVKGYNVDTEYIDGIIRDQTTLPNSTDFNNTVSGLIPLFVPGLVIILLIYFIFRFIKKVF